jgi:RHS repeat-associated protein
VGRCGTVSDGARTASMAYDALGRQVSETSYVGTRTMQFDLAGRMTRLTHTDGYYVMQDYLVTGEVSAIRENGAASGIGVLGTYAYDDLGRMTSLTRGNGAVTSYVYDPVSRMSSLSHDLAGTTNDVTTAFTYNPASQITSNTRNNDIYAWNGHYNVDRPYTVNGLNQLTTAGVTTLGYDGRGNLTSSGTTTYGYTSENRLATGSGPTAVSNAYDPLGRLSAIDTATTTTNFDYLGSAAITELDWPAYNIKRRYVFGPGDDAPLVWYEGSGTTDRRWLIPDERGSIIAVTDGTGAVTNVNRYDEYGVPATTNVGRFQYTGQAWIPEIGMYYYKARIYAPTLGRFMQTDPVGYSAGVNWYDYVGGDPVNRSDPSGLIKEPSYNSGCAGNSPNPDCTSASVLANATVTNEPTDKHSGKGAANAVKPSIGHNGGPPLEGAGKGIGSKALGILGAIVDDLLFPDPAGPAKEGIGGAVVTDGTQVSGRFPNKSGPDSILYRAQNGRITNYQVYDRQGYPRLRVDLAGKSHAGISTPHTVEYSVHTGPGGQVSVNPSPTRPATWFEIP